MELICDYREKHILKQINIVLDLNKNKEENIYKDLNIKSENLHLGDFIIGNMIIERKTHRDLASSILDGRYKEQSNRLQEYLKENPDKKVVYFIEGNFNLFIKNHNIDKDKLISCIMSLFYEKGFFVIMTNNICETTNFLLKFCIKYHNKYKNTYEDKKGGGCIKINKKKNSQINKENIGIMMLSNIPNVSEKIAIQLLEPFNNSIYKFMEKIREDSDYLNNFKIKSKDKERKLGKNIIQNINNLIRD